MRIIITYTLVTVPFSHLKLLLILVLQVMMLQPHVTNVVNFQRTLQNHSIYIKKIIHKLKRKSIINHLILIIILSREYKISHQIYLLLFFLSVSRNYLSYRNLLNCTYFIIHLFKAESIKKHPINSNLMGPDPVQVTKNL